MVYNSAVHLIGAGNLYTLLRDHTVASYGKTITQNSTPYLSLPVTACLPLYLMRHRLNSGASAGEARLQYRAGKSTHWTEAFLQG